MACVLAERRASGMGTTDHLARTEPNDTAIDHEDRLRQAQTAALSAAIEAVQYRAALDGITDGYLTVDRDWRCTYLNAAAARMLGLSRNAIVGQSIQGRLAQLSSTMIDAIEEQAIAAGGSQSFAWELTLQHTWLDVRVFANDQGYTVFLHDVTERKLAEAALRQAERRFRTLVEQIPVTTYTYDHGADARVLFMSPQIESLTGYPAERFIEDPDFWHAVIHPDDRARTQAEIARTNASGEPYETEYRIRHRDGHIAWVRNQAVLVRDDNGNPLIWQGVLQDITEQKQREAELAHQAFHDPLTGLPNRLLFNDRLQQELERAERYGRQVAVLYLDLDDFKGINDLFGHPVGDQVLVTLAQRYRDTLRSIDTVARLGGDEFVVLLPALHDESDAAYVAQRLLAALRDVIMVEGHAVLLSGSIGIALSRPGEPGPELIERADQALYEAKETGKNHYAIAGSS
jgi:diguanylate cyclase (GGDEF)-like protein/PAS domain S-box-containing protein